MIMGVVGFLAPFLPNVLGMFQGWLDHKQELEMMKLRGDQAALAQTWKMEEMELQANAADRLEARKPIPSFGVQLLDKAQDNKVVWRWTFNVVFLAFGFLDWITSSVRPVTTYWAFGLYAATKMALLGVIYASAAKFNETAWDAAAATLTNEAAFTTFDQDMLVLIIGFWFGQQAKSGRSAAQSK